jgi:hypothetical protein
MTHQSRILQVTRNPFPHIFLLPEALWYERTNRPQCKSISSTFCLPCREKNFKINDSFVLSFESVTDALWMVDFVKFLGAANVRT